MKRIFLIALALVSEICSAQTFTVNNLAVNGTSNHTGAATFSIRPTFNGNTPWDSGNFTPSNYLTTATAASTYCPLASCAMTGTPTAPTAATGTNTTQLATTAFVAKHTLCPSVIDFGGDPTGTNDNSTALTNALAAAPTGRACAYFGPGKWKFNSQFSYTLPNSTSSLTILGAGQDVTELTWPNAAGGMLVTSLGPYDTLHVRDMTFTTGVANGGNALNFSCTGCNIPNPANSAISDITNVTFRGSDGYEVSNYWSIGANVNIQPNVNFSGVLAVGPATVGGIGISINGSSSTIAAPYNITGSSFNALSTGINYGNWTQGVTVNQSNFTGTANGILAASGLSGLDQLYVAGSQFNCQSNAILIQTPMNAMMFTGNFFLVPSNAVGIQLQNVAQFSIYGNTFNPAVNSPTNATGIVVGPYFAQAGVISANQFAALNLAVNIQNTAKNVNLQSNSYSNNGSNLSNACVSGCTIGGGSQ